MSKTSPMLTSCLLLIVSFSFISAGPHSHKFENKEKVEDGAFSPRDRYHFQEGEHHAEFDHESILGSHSAAEEFDHLSPEESKRRLKLLALKMDKNSDGFVDKAEIMEWVLKSFKMLTEEEAMDQLEDEDSDDDGKVTWQEHLSETYGLFDDDAIPSLSSEDDEEIQMLQNDKELFKAADLNGDDVLDTAEFSSFSHPEEFVHMHQIVYEHTMQKRDKDKDGYLSLEEFLADGHGSIPVPSTEQHISGKDHFVNDFDKDKDGRLNREEVLLWLIPNNVEMAENEADHLIENSDTDHDGILSIEEIVDNHEIFVGSEATDFGEHLRNTHKFNDEL